MRFDPCGSLTRCRCIRCRIRAAPHARLTSPYEPPTRADVRQAKAEFREILARLKNSPQGFRFLERDELNELLDKYAVNRRDEAA